jgi:hypothetical protein
MLCKEKAALLDTYVLTARKFSDAISRLEDSLSDEDFASAHTVAEEILQDLAVTRMQFHAHLKEHGCQTTLSIRRQTAG